MGIYIKDMDMPKDGEMLCINIYPDGKVCINLDLECKQIATAVSVPKHGRLIDADALEDEGADVHEDVMCCGYVEDAIWGFSHDMIHNAPTVIPASKEDKT